MSSVPGLLAQAHTGLTSLDLSENPIRDEGAIALAPALGSMPHLDRLLLVSAAIQTRTG